MASPPDAFFHAFMTNTSLTPVTAIVSMPLPLMAAAFFTKPGRWLLLQVGVNAPGTANSTTFLPLKISSVVFGLGPSPVITVKVAVGTLSPTLIAMDRFLSRYRLGTEQIWVLDQDDCRAHVSAPGELVETKYGLGRGAACHRGGELELRAVGLGAGRQPVDLECKAPHARGRVRD